MKTRALMKSLPVVFALAACLTGCGGADGSYDTQIGPTPSASTAGTSAEGVIYTNRNVGSLFFTLSAPKRVYAPGETISLTFIVQNRGTTEASSDYLNINPNELADATVENSEGLTIARLAKTFGAGNVYSGKFVYGAGEIKKFTFDWDQIDSTAGTGQPRAAAGVYKIGAYMTAGNVDGQTVGYGVLGTEPLEIEIR